MKEKFIDEIKEIFVQGRRWVECEAEYIKLTAAEKFTILLSTLIMGGIVLALVLFALGLMSFALVDVFRMIMSPVLAFLSAAGCILVLAVVLYLLRKPLLFNPIARFITRLLLDKK